MEAFPDGAGVLGQLFGGLVLAGYAIRQYLRERNGGKPASEKLQGEILKAIKDTNETVTVLGRAQDHHNQRQEELITTFRDAIARGGAQNDAQTRGIIEANTKLDAVQRRAERRGES